jgi:hypothetical protein
MHWITQRQRKQPLRLRWRYHFLFVFLLWTSPAWSEPIQVTRTNFAADGQWLYPTDAVELRVSRLPSPEEGNFAVLLGTLDITSQIKMLGADLTYTPTALPLPSGQQEVVLYVVSPANDWTEVGRFPLRVLTTRGFRQADLTPKLDLNWKTRLVESRNDGAGKTDRPSPFNDFTLQGGLDTNFERGDFVVKSQAALLGSSREKEALRFSQLRNSAPKLDLSSYLFDVTRGKSQFSFGHINYGANRHLLQNVANRGLVFRHKLNDRFDVSINTMTGRSIVGYDNFFGMADLGNNNITSGTVGVNLLQNGWGTLRFEGMWMQGRLKPQTSFNVGQIVDAEKSRGFGLRLFGNTWNGRVRTELSFARSTFDNPSDRALGGGLALVGIKQTTNNARYFDLAVDVIQNYAFWWGKSLSLTLSGSHERIDPQFKSLGMFTTANQDINQFGIDGNVGEFSFQLRHTWTEDNLDDIASILTTKTRNATANFGFPLRSLFSGTRWDTWWMPSVNYGFGWTHQFSPNKPSLDPDGFRLDNIPDQLDVTHTTGASWSGEWWQWSLGYQFLHSFQDNRQQGRNVADFTNYTHLVTVSLRPRETLTFNIGGGWTDAANKERELTRMTRTANFGFEWQFRPNWALTGTYSYTDEDDSANQSISRSYILDTQISRRFELPTRWGKKLPCRFFLRHALQSNIIRDRVFILATDSAVWTVDAGVSVSMF